MNKPKHDAAKGKDQPHDHDGKGGRKPLNGGHWVTVHLHDGDARHVYISGAAGHRGKILAGGHGIGIGSKHAGKTVVGVTTHPAGTTPSGKRKSWQEKDRPAKMDFMAGAHSPAVKPRTATSNAIEGHKTARKSMMADARAVKRGVNSPSGLSKQGNVAEARFHHDKAMALKRGTPVPATPEPGKYARTPAKATPTLKERAAAHRASKGTHEQRAQHLAGKATEKVWSVARSEKRAGNQLAKAESVSDRSPAASAARDKFSSVLKRKTVVAERLRKVETIAHPAPSLKDRVVAHRAAKGTRQERLEALGKKMQTRANAAHKKTVELQSASEAAHKSRMFHERLSDSAESRPERMQAKREAESFRQRAAELADKAAPYRQKINRLENRSPRIGAAIKAERAAKAIPARHPAAATVTPGKAPTPPPVPQVQSGPRAELAARLKAARKAKGDDRHEALSALQGQRQATRKAAYDAKAGPVSDHVQGKIKAAFEKAPGAKDNFAKLVDVRRDLPGVSRPAFDANLRAMRQRGEIALDSHEGLHGAKLSRAEKTAGVKEAGSNLVYAARGDSYKAPASLKEAVAAHRASKGDKFLRSQQIAGRLRERVGAAKRSTTTVRKAWAKTAWADDRYTEKGSALHVASSRKLDAAERKVKALHSRLANFQAARGRHIAG
jgi:hypothetical protein